MNSKYDGTLDILIGERIDNNTINNAEHDRRRPDAESQGKDGDEGETAIFAEVAQSVVEVAGETTQVGFHTSKLYNEAAKNRRDLTMTRRVAIQGG